jgi:hypothetical protein
MLLGFFTKKNNQFERREELEMKKEKVPNLYE